MKDVFEKIKEAADAGDPDSWVSRVRDLFDALGCTSIRDWWVDIVNHARWDDIADWIAAVFEKLS